ERILLLLPKHMIAVHAFRHLYRNFHRLRIAIRGDHTLLDRNKGCELGHQSIVEPQLRDLVTHIRPGGATLRAYPVLRHQVINLLPRPEAGYHAMIVATGKTHRDIAREGLAGVLSAQAYRSLHRRRVASSDDQ